MQTKGLDKGKEEEEEGERDIEKIVSIPKLKRNAVKKFIYKSKDIPNYFEDFEEGEIKVGDFVLLNTFRNRGEKERRDKELKVSMIGVITKITPTKQSEEGSEYRGKFKTVFYKALYLLGEDVNVKEKGRNLWTIGTQFALGNWKKIYVLGYCEYIEKKYLAELIKDENK